MILDDITRCRGCGAWTAHARGRCTPCARAVRLQDTLDRLALAHLTATPTRDRRHHAHA